MNTVYFVIPCYNEEEVLRETIKRLGDEITGLEDKNIISRESRILLVDDGSRDGTWNIISQYSARLEYICGVKLSRNCGHQNALLAGLMTAKDFCDAAISLDADLQDDIGVIPEFIEKFNSGCEIVYGVRNSRETDTVFKRGSAHGFYKLMNKMGVELVNDHADYRLMSKKALDALSQFKEINLFLRGIMPILGFKTGRVYYQRHKRFAGESKYPLKKMIAFALDGITSFSTVPLKLIGGVGFVVCIISLFALVYAVISKFSGNAHAGWASIVGSIWFIGGILLMSTGICGEYVGKIYKEVKARPHYIIDTTILK